MGKTVTAFKDIGKACSDLLSKDYKVGQSTVELKTKTPNGITFTPTGTKKDNNSFDGSCTAKGAAFGIEAEAKLDTAGVLSGTFEAADLISKGVLLSLDCKSGETSLLGGAKATAEYKTDVLNAKCTYDCFSSAAGVAMSTAYQALTMGCSADYNLGTGKLTAYEAACQYVQPDFTVGAKLAEKIGKGQVYKCSYYHKVSGDMQVGGELMKAMKNDSPIALAFGCAYKLDKDTTLKSKVDSEGTLYASYKQKVSKLTTMTLAAKIDTVNLSANEHKFGMVLNLTP